VARDGAAVEQVPGLTTQPLDERGRGVERKADQVDDHVELEVGNAVGECTVAVLDGSIRCDVTYLLPGGVVEVAGPLPAADVDHVMSGGDQLGNQKRADVSASTDDSDSHDVRLNTSLTTPAWRRVG
jgi:hypothetical protein